MTIVHVFAGLIQQFIWSDRQTLAFHPDKFEVVRVPLDHYVMLSAVFMDIEGSSPDCELSRLVTYIKDTDSSSWRLLWKICDENIPGPLILSTNRVDVHIYNLTPCNKCYYNTAFRLLCTFHSVTKLIISYFVSLCHVYVYVCFS